MWSSDDSVRVFIKYEHLITWYELKNNFIINSLFFIKSMDKDVILYNQKSSTFFRLTSDGLFSGLNVNNINSKIFDGKWIYFELSKFVHV